MSDPPRHNGRVQPLLRAPTEYIDVQRGSLLVTVLAISSALTLIATAIWPHVLGTFALIAQLLLAVCFCTLFIRVQDGYLLWQFGPGWIRGKIALADITSSHVITSPFAYGWGFEPARFGWRFNRQSALAVVIQCRKGKRLRLGTSRAHELQRFLMKRTRPVTSGAWDEVIVSEGGDG